MQMKRPKSLCMCNKLTGEIQAGEIWIPAHFILYVCTYTIFVGWCWFNEQVMIRHISASGLYLIQVRRKFRVGGGELWARLDIEEKLGGALAVGTILRVDGINNRCNMCASGSGVRPSSSRVGLLPINI